MDRRNIKKCKYKVPRNAPTHAPPHFVSQNKLSVMLIQSSTGRTRP